MIPRTKFDGNHASQQASSSSESRGRKWTLSCSRCRASKLKCDRGEPCLECVKRNIGHLCTKDERHPRAKRAKTNHETSTSASSKNDEPGDQDAGAEETAELLERFANGVSRPNGDLHAVLQPTSSLLAPEYANPYWSERQDEGLALMQEIVAALPDAEMIHHLYGVFITRCKGPLGNVVHTPTFMEQVEVLCRCLNHDSTEETAMALSSAMSMDAIACHLLALVLALAFHPTPSILGWSSTPLTLRVQQLRASNKTSKTWRSLALRCLRGCLSLFCGSIAALQAAIMLLLEGRESSLDLDAILITAISGAQRLGLHRLGDTGLKPAIPTPTDEISSTMSTDLSHIRTEVGIRIWWALVVRDWSRGQGLGYYYINPSQFNTRTPLHINDLDLLPDSLTVNSNGYITERPRTEFTELSYTVHTLSIAGFAREFVDFGGYKPPSKRREERSGTVEMRSLLTKKYEEFIVGLPPYFRLGSNVGLSSTDSMAAIPVHRWMLHQQLWSLFLRLHRDALSSQYGRASCQLLAQNIINSQAQIQSRCAVCNSLSTNESQLFNAATFLLLDLLFSPKSNDPDRSSAQLRRFMMRDKVQEAIDLLQPQKDVGSHSSRQDPQADQMQESARERVAVLENLMKLEDEECAAVEESNEDVSRRSVPGEQEASDHDRARKSLRSKVQDTLLQGVVQNSVQSNLSSPYNSRMALPSSTDTGFENLDALPLLSNDPNTNLWEFLDFDSPSLLDNGLSSSMTDPSSGFDPSDITSMWSS